MGVILIALGVGGTVGGGILLGLDGEITCQDGDVITCPRVFETTTTGSLLLGAGAVSITSGIFLLIWNAFTEDPPPAAAHNLQFQWDPRQNAGLFTTGFRY